MLLKKCPIDAFLRFYKTEYTDEKTFSELIKAL